MFSDCVATCGVSVDNFMTLYTKVFKPTGNSNNNSAGSDLFTSLVRRLELTDEEFLIVLHNKLQHMEHDKPVVWPAVLKTFHNLLSALGIKLKKEKSAPTRILLTGMELTKLRELTGFEEHEKISPQDDYEMELPVLRQLLKSAAPN